jgi:preprotein translocase subunit YajC
MQSLLFPVIVFAALYMLFIRPEQQKQKKAKSMMNSLKVGDTIFTRGGIHGTIVDMAENLVTITTGPDKIKISITRGAVGSVIESASFEEEATPEEAITLDEEIKPEISLDKKNE